MHPHIQATSFSTRTSTGVLRKHLYERHADAWIAGCKRLNIPITAKEAQPAIEEYQRRQGQQPQSDANSTNNRRAFSHEAFVDALVEFIVSDDQVCPSCLTRNVNVSRPFIVYQRHREQTPTRNLLDAPRRTQRHRHSASYNYS